MTNNIHMGMDGKITFGPIKRLEVEMDGIVIPYDVSKALVVVEGETLKVTVERIPEATAQGGFKVGDKVRPTMGSINHEVFEDRKERTITRINRYSVYFDGVHDDSYHYSWVEKINK